MTAEQITSAIDYAQTTVVRWLSKEPELGGKEMYRHLLKVQTLSRIAGLTTIDPPVDELAPNDAPSFGSGGHVYDDEKGARLIALASTGDDDADAVLCDIGGEFVHRGCALPPRLRGYICLRLTGMAWPRRRGRKTHTNAFRNYVITEIVSELIRRGFCANRNEATEVPSACSIAAEALKRAGINLTEHAVSKVWADYAHFTYARAN